MAPYLTAANAILRDDRLADFDATKIDARIAAFEEIAEPYRGVAFTSRTATAVKVRGQCGTQLQLDHRKIAAPTVISIDGTALTAPQLAEVRIWADAGIIERDMGWSGDQISLTYTHGYATPPAAVLDACTEYVLCTLRARASGVSRNTLSEATEAGTTRYSTPDWAAGRPTGWLEVDRLLNSLPDYRPHVGIG